MSHVRVFERYRSVPFSSSNIAWIIFESRDKTTIKKNHKVKMLLNPDEIGVPEIKTLYAKLAECPTVKLYRVFQELICGATLLHVKGQQSKGTSTI
jgi:hypothetical protein